MLIVGAGLAGIGAACRLRTERPGTSFIIVEARDAIGGTWDLFRFPGVRSDSDMTTLGYPFRPWDGPQAIADGAAIRDYIRETAERYEVVDAIRFHHRAISADWSVADARWQVEIHRSDDGTTVRLSCAWLYVCSGYIRYDRGYAPAFPGVGEFIGSVVHPQHWPADLEVRDRHVVVIGSGATAATLVPALVRDGASVTMVQRSPGYVLSLPATDQMTALLRRSPLPAALVHRVVRWRNILATQLLYRLSRRFPTMVKHVLRKGVSRRLGSDFDIATHFTPRYQPWDQRMCFVPDGDLFTALKSGRATIVTDEAVGFSSTGVRVASGTEIPADIIVTATGLSILALGGMTLAVDSAAVELSKTVAYKGAMLSGVPNFVMAIGYTNASWTLKCDLVSRYVCRLLAHMDENGFDSCTPVPPPPEMPLQPFISLQSGYVRRGSDQLPLQGASVPWRLHQNYLRDRILLLRGRIDDRGVRFGRRPSAHRASSAHRATLTVAP